MANSDGTLKGVVNYTSRDYESIMKDFWEILPALTALWEPQQDTEDLTEIWKPEANADPGVVLAKWTASIADMLGVNLDWVANELYAPSVSQRKDAEKLFGLIGYKLGWYQAARTEITFTNNTDTTITLDFGFSGAAFTTCTAFTDITGASRTITYNILPLTSSYGDNQSRATKQDTSFSTDIFADTDKVKLGPGEYVTRVGIEGELRSYTVSVAAIKENNYIINIPSQHVDTTAIWIKAKASQSASDFLATQWQQCTSPADFNEPEPRFAVTYDNYSNAQIQVSNYLNQLENYENNYLTVYWIDCSGVIGCVGKDVFQDFVFAKGGSEISFESNDVSVSNLANTVELPHTYAMTGKSPETAKEAYYSSRNYINTWDSLITLPDFNRFLNREPGVDCGKVIDCQKAFEINMAILNDKNLTSAQKQKQFITNLDFPEGDLDVDWDSIISSRYDEVKTTYIVKEGDTLASIARTYGITEERLAEFNNLNAVNNFQPGVKLYIPNDVDQNVMKKLTSNFKTYTAMCFAIHNDFNDSIWGRGRISPATVENKKVFVRYKPPTQFITNIVKDYRPLQAMSVELQFGYVRVFPFYIVGQIYPTHPVTKDAAETILETAREALRLYFSPANRHIGDIPTVMEVVKIIQNSHESIAYFDAGSIKNPIINWKDCDVDYFNAISFARYVSDINNSRALRIAPEYIIEE